MLFTLWRYYRPSGEYRFQTSPRHSVQISKSGVLLREQEVNYGYSRAPQICLVASKPS